jgi:hypothetical protein
MFHFDSAEEYVSLYEEKFGPVLMAKRALEPEGRWEALRDDMIALFETHDTADGLAGEYLAVTGKKG